MTTLIPGTKVEARGLPWEVVHVEPAGEQYRYRLRCTQPGLQLKEVDLLCPFEEIRPIVTQLDPSRPGRVKQWRLYHSAFLLEQALGPAALMAVQPGRLDIAPYQLVPVMRALRMGRPRLLLADGVGLGKTVEAGLIMAELIARRRAHRILVVSPAGPLLKQWHTELRDRFGLRFNTISSAGELMERRRGELLGANPFDSLSYCLLSVDFAKQEKLLQDLERTAWDLVVIDEAHHCVRLGRDGDFEDSRRRRLAEVLAKQSDGLLLLTATPHDGYDEHFASLVELLDPSLVDGRGRLRAERYRHHVVRRLKQHIKHPETGEPLFKQRVVTPLSVPFDSESHADFAAFQQALLAAVAPRLRMAVKQHRFGEVLAFVALLKRSVSTAAACLQTLQVVRQRYAEMVAKGAVELEERTQRLKTLREYRRRMERFGALSLEEELDQANLEAEDLASELMHQSLEDVAASIAEIRRAQKRGDHAQRQISGTSAVLDELVQMASEAAAQDPKLPAVLLAISEIRGESPDANVLVYTEYTDSLKALEAYLRQQLAAGALAGEVLVISGDDPDKVRAQVTSRFATEPRLVLLSTDATAEGLNLHYRCHHLIHLELPYNPNRLEQRNGRIDRYGQPHAPEIRYLYLAGTFEERLLLKLVAKYEKQRARLTFVPDTLGGITTDDAQTVRLLEGLADEGRTLFQRSPHTLKKLEEADDDTSTPAYKELLAEVERSMASFEKAAKTASWLVETGLNAESKLLAEADLAFGQGRKLGAVDLLQFVSEAIQADSRSTTGGVVRHLHSVVEMDLMELWVHGMKDMPGYDEEARVLRLSTDKALTKDTRGRTLGYLGRAHPIVRRALDRVRSIRFGESDTWLDRRVAAIGLPAGDDKGPSLLFTFLGVLESGLGNEVERVLACRIWPDGSTQVMPEPDSWLQLLESGQGVASTGLWDQQFKSWAQVAQQQAAEAVQLEFRQIAQPLLEAHQKQLAEELEDLDAWLRARADSICGPVRRAQADLFSGDTSAAPRWQMLQAPLERLAAFEADGSNLPSARREADGVIRLHQQRKKALTQRSEAKIQAPVLLGLLMLVPVSDGRA